MAVLQRVSFEPNERLDTPDLRSIEAFLLNDFRFYLSGFYSENSYILQGFEITNYATIFTVPGFSLQMSDVVLFHSEANTQAAGFYVHAGTEPDAAVTLASNSTNFVEADFSSVSSTPDVRAFWDQGANAGLGGEFTDTINTVINLQVSVTSNITGFTDGKMPLYKVVVNPSGVVTSVTDCRNLFFRLGTGGSAPDPSHNFSFPSLPDITHARLETPITATAATATNAIFQGGDKNFKTFKDWMDVVMTSIKEIKGVPFWYMPGSGGSTVPAAFQNAALIVFSNGQWQHLPAPIAAGHLALVGASTIYRLGFINNLTLYPFSDINLTTNTALYIIAPATDMAVTYSFGQDAAMPISPKATSGQTSSTLTVALGGNYITTGGLILVHGQEFAYSTYTPGTGLFSGVSPDPTGIAIVGDLVYQSNTSTGYYHFSTQARVPNVVGSVSNGAERTIWLAQYNATNSISLRNNIKLTQGEESEIDDLANANYKALPAGYTSIVNTTNILDQDITFTGGGTLTFAIPSIATLGTIGLSGTLSLAANEVAYCMVNRDAPPAIADLTGLTVIPLAQCPFGEDIFIFAYRLATTDIFLWDGLPVPLGTNRTLPVLDSDVSKLFGQLQLKPHPSSVSKVIVTGADFTLSDGRVLSQELVNLIMNFSGAVIHLDTGLIFASDDSTSLGIDFTPFTIPSGNYFWYSVNVIAGALGADNRIAVQLIVSSATASNAVLASAPYPSFVSSAKKSGAVLVRNVAGTITLQLIRQLGVGSGSGAGGGGGSGSDIVTRAQERLLVSSFQHLNPNDFLAYGTTKVLSATATYDNPTGTYTFSGAGQNVISTNLLDADFMAAGLDVGTTEVMTFWATYDVGQVVQFTRDQGLNYQAVTMSRVGTSDLARGVINFTEEVTQVVLSTYSVSNADTNSPLNATTAQWRAQAVTLTGVNVLKQMILYVRKLGSPLGHFKVRVVADNAGLPSTNLLDILSESASVDITALSAGNNTVTITMPKAVLQAGDYWIVLVPDTTYTTSYSGGVTELDVRTDTSSPSSPHTNSVIYNGTSWSSVANTKWTYQFNGRPLDLRLRITSGNAGVALSGYGVLYGFIPGIITGQKNIEIVEIDGDDDVTDFTLTEFLPNADFLRVYLAGSGQVFLFPDFQINGQVITFPAGTFLFPGERIILKFIQSEGQGFDSSDQNGALLTDNHLGSTSVALDRSVAGRGIFLRRPDGTLREITIDDDDRIVVWSV